MFTYILTQTLRVIIQQIFESKILICNLKTMQFLLFEQNTLKHYMIKYKYIFESVLTKYNA